MFNIQRDDGQDFIEIVNDLSQSLINSLMSSFQKYFSLVTVESTSNTIFQFSDFVSGFAILIVLFTLTDIRYRFRASIANFLNNTFLLIYYAFLGFSMLLIEFLYSSKSSIPNILSNIEYLQTFFGILFLLPIIYWVYSAFIKPPVYSKYNSSKYANILYNIILQGSEKDLPTIANELSFSAENIILFADKPNDNLSKRKLRKESYKYIAHDILLLIADRRFCKAIIQNSSITAINFINAISKHSKYTLPINQFCINIFEEALCSEDSILFHENEGYYSGLLGYLKPFKNSFFSDFNLIEGLSNNNRTIFDIHYKTYRSWNADQLKAYCDCVIIFFKSYFTKMLMDNMLSNSYAFARAIDIISSSCEDLYKIDKISDEYHESEYFNKLNVVVHFFRDLISFLSGYEIVFSHHDEDIHKNELYIMVKDHQIFYSCITPHDSVIKNKIIEGIKIPSDKPTYNSNSFSQEIQKSIFSYTSKNGHAFSNKTQFQNAKLRNKKCAVYDGIYGIIANLMFEITHAASYISSPPETCWMIQHNIVLLAWKYLPNSLSLNIISHRYRRMVYDEILRMNDSPNYKSARILGFFLNVLGLKLPSKQYSDKNYYALHKAILSWTKENFLRIYKYNPDIAICCLIGGVNYDQENNILVKKYSPRLDGSISQVELILDPLLE